MAQRSKEGRPREGRGLTAHGEKKSLGLFGFVLIYDQRPAQNLRHSKCLGTLLSRLSNVFLYIFRISNNWVTNTILFTN